MKTKLMQALLVSSSVGSFLFGCDAASSVESPPAATADDDLATVAAGLSGLVEDVGGDGWEALASGDAVRLDALRLTDGHRLSDALGLSGEQGAAVTVRAPLGLPAPGESWLVTWVPAAAESLALEYYRHGALAMVLDAETTPEVAVLLLEVADHEGEVVDAEAERAPRSNDPMKQVRLKKIRILQDSEFGPFNDPELYMSCAFPNGESVKVYLPNVDEEKKWYTRDKFIVNWYASYGNPMRCGFWEEDGGSYGTVTVTATAQYGGVTGLFEYRFPIHDDDDNMGQQIINWNDPNCTMYSSGDVDFRLCW